MAQVITPIKAHIGYDDVEKIWSIKISRAEADTGGNIPWVDILEKFATLAEALVFLLQYWAASGTGAGTSTTAEKFDVPSFINSITSWTGFPHVDPSPPTGGPATYPGAEPGLNPSPIIT